MPSPFPGMDPYLEGYLWRDVHNALASQFRRQLAPLLHPHYVARLEVYTVSDNIPAQELGLVFMPDVEILRPSDSPLQPASSGASFAPVAVMTPPTVSIPITLPLQVRLVSVQIRDAAGNELITAIEILSPTNKREPELMAYRRKRDELIMAGVHLLEIDLIRRGMRPVSTDDWPASDYRCSLIRRRHVQAELWPLSLRERLPVLPVPLRHPDPDVPLDLSLALATIYDEAYYAASLDYTAPPPEPPCSEDDLKWLDGLLREVGVRG